MRRIFLNLTAIFIAGSLMVVCFSGCRSDRPGRSLESSIEGSGWSDLKMWYRQPAEQWIEALPVGNGRLGAMVYGRLHQEIIQLNEDTIWTGGPYQPSEPEGPKELSEVRRLVFEGKFRKAEEIFGRIMATNPSGHQKYQPLGTLQLVFPENGPIDNYRRELDLDTAISSVSYRSAGIEFRREIFVSPVDQVIVVRMTADTPGQITCRVAITGAHNSPPRDEFSTVEAKAPNILILKGKTASYRGVEGRVRFQAQVKVIPEGGTLSAKESEISVKAADALTLLIPAATNFVSYQDISGDPEARVNATLAGIEGKTYDRMRADHVAEHRRLFRRVNLDLGNDHAGKTAHRRTAQAIPGWPRSKFGGPLFPIRALSVDIQFPTRNPPSQSSGDLEREHESLLGFQIHHKYQLGDELLACRGSQSGRMCRAACGDGGRSRRDRTPDCKTALRG